MIFDSQDGLGAALAERLEMQRPPLRRSCRPAAIPSPGGRRCASSCPDGEPGRRGVVYLSGLDVDGPQEAPDFAAARDARLGRRAGRGARLGRSRRDRAAAVVAGHPRRPGRGQIARCRWRWPNRPLWGLGRVIAAEHPELACTRIDLDPEDRRDAADQLAEELCAGQGEDQVAYRGGERRVARLRRLRHGEAGGLEAPARPALPAGNHLPRPAR